MINSGNLDKIIKLVKKEIGTYHEPVLERLHDKMKSPYWVLIGCLLSLRTKDETTEKVLEVLYKEAKTPEAIQKLPIKKLEKILHPVGFYRNKSKTVKTVTDIVINKYKKKVPQTLDELLTMPGVGRKTANLVITVAFDKYGICVDTHVHKIFNRWGFLKTKTPDETELKLREVLPKKYWKSINSQLVIFGKNICLSVSPLCSKCSLNKLCPKLGVGKHR